MSNFEVHSSNIELCSDLDDDNNKYAYELADKLKEVYDKAGKENRHVSAEIFHQLGNIYCQYDDMINMIKSAALYNAAIVRSPENAHVIRNDLETLCINVLSHAQAQSKHADLIAKSKQVKQEINAMRMKVERKLSDPQTVKGKVDLEYVKIQFIRNLQDEITADYSKIMKNLSCYCESVMGTAPCKFALIGMGSLARREITPYSDFEHVIVLPKELLQEKADDKVLNYFRWFSVIFHIVLVNLHETILPSVAIECLNRHRLHGDWFFDRLTTRGICFDGMLPQGCKFPLGRQNYTEKKDWKTELIKPLDEMLEYLTSDEDLKNGYHLKDILTKVCFVYGDDNIFEEFKKSVFNMLDKQTYTEKINDIKSQLIDDLANFTIRTNIVKLKSSVTMNVKRVFYRSTTLFIAALGRIYNIHAFSCFDIIEKLAEKRFITQSAKHKLMYAVALACEIRLKWYMKCKSQTNIIEMESNNKTALQKLCELFEKSDLFSYFQIAYALQCDISNRLDLKKLHFYINPGILNFNLYLSFGETEKLLQHSRLENNIAFSSFKRLYTFDEVLDLLETTRCPKENCNPLFDKNFAVNSNATKYIYEIGLQLKENNRKDEALEYFEAFIYITKEALGKDMIEYGLELNNLDETDFEHQENINFLSSFSKPKAIESWKIALKTIAEASTSIADCLASLNKYPEAIKYLVRSKKLLEQLSSDLDVEHSYAALLNKIGNCFRNLKKYNKASTFLLYSKKIKEQSSSDLKIDKSYASTLNNIGLCHMDIGEFEKALTFLKQSMKIKKQLHFNDDNNKSLASTLNNIGLCLIDMNNHEKALDNLKGSLQIKKELSRDLSNDKSYAYTLTNIGICYIGLKQLVKAIDHLQQSLEIKERLSLDPDSDKSLACTQHYIGVCLMKMSKYSEALISLEKSRKIWECLPLSDNRTFVKTLKNINTCLIALNRQDDAKVYFLRAEEIIRQLSLEIDVDYIPTSL